MDLGSFWTLGFSSDHFLHGFKSGIAACTAAGWQRAALLAPPGLAGGQGEAANCTQPMHPGCKLYPKTLPVLPKHPHLLQHLGASPLWLGLASEDQFGTRMPDPQSHAESLVFWRGSSRDKK